MTVKFRKESIWDHLPDDERCPECGQPDNCGDCNHEPLTEADIQLLLGDLSIGVEL